MQFNLEHNGEEITVVHQVDSYGSKGRCESLSM